MITKKRRRAMHAWYDSASNPWCGVQNTHVWDGLLPRMGEIIFFSARPRAEATQWGWLSCEVDDAGEEYYNFGPAGCGIEESRNLTEEAAWLIIETLRSVME